MTEILGVVEGNKVNKQTLAATTLAVGATSAAGSVASRPQISRWYSRVRKPSYVPPNKVFPIVWTSLYADIAVTSATAIDRFREQGRDDEARKYTVALAANLILNGAWSWLFFKYRKLGASAIGAGLLAASSADLVKRTAAADPRAGAALAPYPLWCSFATLMSGHIWVLNRR